MPTGAITQYIDVAQIVLYAFWFFFAGLIFYLHRENKREGYPLEAEGTRKSLVQGFPAMPRPKTYLTRDGRTVMAPNPRRELAELAATPWAPHLGAALNPTGNPMLDGIGPGAYAQRPDVPDTTVDNTPRIVPLRIAPELSVARRKEDPRGLPVLGTDGVVGGTVKELWVDRAEMLFRFIEVSVADGRSVMLPINFAKIGARSVVVDSILGSQFGAVPAIKSSEQITMLEEERVMAYYGAGTLYAKASRSEPLL